MIRRLFSQLARRFTEPTQFTPQNVPTPSTRGPFGPTTPAARSNPPAAVARTDAEHNRFYSVPSTSTASDSRSAQGVPGRPASFATGGPRLPNVDDKNALAYGVHDAPPRESDRGGLR